MSRPERLWNQRGTSTLEFIVVLPTLFLIFLGSVELSRAWLTSSIASSAAREGARVAAVSPALGTDPNNPVFDPSRAVDRINEVLLAANLTAATTVTCTPPPGLPPGFSGCVPDSRVQAEVTVSFQTFVPLMLPMLGTADTPLALRHTAIMRRE